MMESIGQTMDITRTQATTNTGTQVTTLLIMESMAERKTGDMTSRGVLKRSGTKTRLGETSLTTRLMELIMDLTIVVLKRIGIHPQDTENLVTPTMLMIITTNTGQMVLTPVIGVNMVSTQRVTKTRNLIILLIFRRSWS